jgi:hypothetical protein
VGVSSVFMVADGCWFLVRSEISITLLQHHLSILSRYFSILLSTYIDVSITKLLDMVLGESSCKERRKNKRLVKVDKRLINEGKQIRVYDRKIIICMVLSRSLQNLEVFK